jgi:dUTP pyrophosphatase
MSYFDTDRPTEVPVTYTLWLVLESEELKKNPYYNFKEKFFLENTNAGFDLISTDSSFEKTVGNRAIYLSDLGVRAVMTRGDSLTPDATVHYRLAPRSSIYKTGYMMANSEGIIDRTYRGVLKAPVVFVGQNAAFENAGLFAGNRYFQILAPDLGWINTVRIVDSLPSTERGAGGFGSTGK